MPFDCTDVLSWVEVIQIDWIKNTNRLPWGFFFIWSCEKCLWWSPQCLNVMQRLTYNMRTLHCVSHIHELISFLMQHV